MTIGATTTASCVVSATSRSSADDITIANPTVRGGVLFFLEKLHLTVAVEVDHLTAKRPSTCDRIGRTACAPIEPRHNRRCTFDHIVITTQKTFARILLRKHLYPICKAQNLLIIALNNSRERASVSAKRDCRNKLNVRILALQIEHRTSSQQVEPFGHTAIKTARATCIQFVQRSVEAQAQSLRRVARSVAHRTMTRKCHTRLQIVSHSTNVAKFSLSANDCGSKFASYDQRTIKQKNSL